jgi:hypothetical protein
MERTHETYTLDADWPTARAARENRTITVTDTAQLRCDYAPEVVETFAELRLRTAVCGPLPGTVLPLGTLELGWDHPHEIDIVEQAVLASLTWTNAGQPPPLLVRPDAAVERLTAHGIMLFPGLTTAPRVEHRLLMPPGSLLLLYTDGLVERPDRDMDLAIDEAAGLLAAHGGRSLDVLLNEITDRIAGPDPKDDIALLALRIPTN